MSTVVVGPMRQPAKRVLQQGWNAFSGSAVLLQALVLGFAISAVAPAARAQTSLLVIDAGTGRTLHERGADVIRYPASLTKMMTLYLLFEALDRKHIQLNSRMRVSRTASGQPPTALGLSAGQAIRVNDAIPAITTKSANDVATLIAETLGGTETRFAARMTRKARALGMRRTTFGNASGLPHPAHRTTARDMAILARALLRDFPHYYHYFGKRRFLYGRTAHPNHNRLLGVYRGMDGIKTGYTRASGYNLVASAKRDGRRLIGVAMGFATAGARNEAMTRLLNAGFRDAAANGRRHTATPKRIPAVAARNERPAIENSGKRPNKTAKLVAYR